MAGINPITTPPTIDAFLQKEEVKNPAVQAAFKAGTLGPYASIEAAVADRAAMARFYEAQRQNAAQIPSTPTDTGAIGWMDILRGPAIAADGSGKIEIGQDYQNGQIVNDRSGDPAKPVLETASQQQARQAEATAGNNALNSGDAASRNAAWAKTLPSHLKPKIEKDADGNEVVTIQGSLLNKIMRDMYSAGEENYQLQNMPEPAVQPQQQQPQQPNPYQPNPVRMQDQTTPQAEVLMRELMRTYPGRSPDEIARILRGGK